MSKRNKQQTMYQPSGQTKRRPVGAKANARNNAKTNTKTNPGSSSTAKNGTRASGRPAQPTPKIANPWNLRIVRIAAIIIAVVAIVGGLAWISFTRANQGSFSPAQIVGLVTLGIVAGIAIAVALRTGDIVSRLVNTMKRERS